MTITLIDDHALIRKAIKKLLEDMGYEVFDTESANFTFDHKTDIVITDISMPQRNGYDIASYVSKLSPETRILALSMLNNEDVILRMLNAGAHGYVSKNADTKEIQNAIETVYRGEYYFTASILKLKSQQKQFNENEIVFLKYCCEGLDFRAIGERMYKSHRTVEKYCNSLFEKLHVNSRGALVSAAYKMGLVDI